MSESTQDQELELLRSTAAKLIEHFDTVQIFVTRHIPGESRGTININYGLGNWFARYGFVKQWLIKADEESRINIRTLNNEDGEADIQESDD